MQHWFVYYKLEASALGEVEPRVRAMLAQVGAESGVKTRLMRRADEAGGAVTLLEVYDGIRQPPSFEASLSAAVARAGLPPALVAQRRTERFEDL